MYSLARFFLFRLDAETAHRLTLKLLDVLYATGLLKLFVRRPPASPVKVMGLTFPNRIGLAAGLDKNGDHIDALAACGFGFIEIGTVTPKPQDGNPKPRLFRAVQDRAIINRMGFNNKGVSHLVAQVKRSRRRCIIGINIGKNKVTPNDRAVQDYVSCLREVYPVADYVTVNISSPNTPGLRELQQGDELVRLLDGLQHEKALLVSKYQRNVPIAVKIAPDLSDDEIDELVDTLMAHNIDAVIATNTTNDKSSLSDAHLQQEQGGLSGAPLKPKANHVLQRLVSKLDGAMPVIAAGGVMSAADAQEKLQLGASLVQIYTGFVYAGPGLILEAVKAGNLAVSQKS